LLKAGKTEILDQQQEGTALPRGVSRWECCIQPLGLRDGCRGARAGKTDFQRQEVKRGHFLTWIGVALFLISAGRERFLTAAVNRSLVCNIPHFHQLTSVLANKRASLCKGLIYKRGCQGTLFLPRRPEVENVFLDFHPRPLCEAFGFALLPSGPASGLALFPSPLHLRLVATTPIRVF